MRRGKPRAIDTDFPGEIITADIDDEQLMNAAARLVHQDEPNTAGNVEFGAE